MFVPRADGESSPEQEAEHNVDQRERVSLGGEATRCCLKLKYTTCMWGTINNTLVSINMTFWIISGSSRTLSEDSIWIYKYLLNVS